jgi:hypothetical protein
MSPQAARKGKNFATFLARTVVSHIPRQRFWITIDHASSFLSHGLVQLSSFLVGMETASGDFG